MKPLAFIPGKKYPSVSITGPRCWLLCDYCKARYLGGMIHIGSPKELYSVAHDVYVSGGYGLLVSGGFTREGYLPVKPYIPVLGEIKRDFKLLISIHPGLIDRDTMIALRDAGVDIVDYELILDEWVLRVLKHLNITVSDHIRHYEEMIEYGPPHVVPHIPIGFTVSDNWIYKAIDLLREYDPEITVFLVSMDSDHRIVERVLNILRKARSKLSGEISLGCMRPFKIKWVLDKKVIEEELVDRIVNPPSKYIREYGLRVVETCCSIPRSLLPI